MSMTEQEIYLGTSLRDGTGRVKFFTTTGEPVVVTIPESSDWPVHGTFRVTRTSGQAPHDVEYWGMALDT